MNLTLSISTLFCVVFVDKSIAHTYSLLDWEQRDAGWWDWTYPSQCTWTQIEHYCTLIASDRSSLVDRAAQALNRAWSWKTDAEWKVFALRWAAAWLRSIRPSVWAFFGPGMSMSMDAQVIHPAIVRTRVAPFKRLPYSKQRRRLKWGEPELHFTTPNTRQN